MEHNQTDCYAFRMYPEPNGTNYYQNDLMTQEQVERLFDYCQILEAIIFDKGWLFLISYYGYEELFEINNKSGWFECSDLEDFKKYIESYQNDIKNMK